MNDDDLYCNLETFGLGLFKGSDANSACTSTNDVVGQDLTLETVLKARKLLENIKDPFAELMREKGFDPEKGDILVWPKRLLHIFGSLPIPSYVRVTGFVDIPHCVKGLSLDINDMELSIKI